ncbi:hypothetical protein HDU67_002592 [Dinochytrium kinnereticum]|nr:hypothetical protein HDU67_002592 [Dinochytrium kinnereticum]
MSNCTQFTQQVEGKSPGIYNWACSQTRCECTKGSTFCGGPGVTVDLTDPIKSATVNFLKDIFPEGLSLPNCIFGECALPTDEPSDSFLSAPVKTLTPAEKSGIGLSVALVAVCFLGLAWALLQQAKAKRKPVPPPRKGAMIAFEKVGYGVGGRVVLNGVSGVARAGKVFAIMGPSAGKNKSGTITGRVTVDGQDLPPSAFKSLTGFVDQDDLLMPTLTVRETLMFSATLRLPESIPIAEKRERVDEILSTLGLSQIADSLVGGGGRRGISGGEKRRVSIGVELVTSPSVLLLDEPTSGLDSFNAFAVVKTLVDLSRQQGKTVIFTIHQPRSDLFTLFDDLLVLSSGSVLYCGPGPDVTRHLKEIGSPCPEGYNVADHLLDLAMVGVGGTLQTVPSPNGTLSVNGASAGLRSRSTGSSQRLSTVDEKHEAKTSSVGVNNTVMVQTTVTTTAPLTRYESDADNTGGRTIYAPSGAPSIADPTSVAVGAPAVLTQSRPASASPTEGEIPVGSVGIGKSYEVGFMTQLSALTTRAAKNLYRNVGLLLSHMVLAVVLGVFVGMLYFRSGNSLGGIQNRLGSLVFLLALLGFSGISAIGSFASERAIYIRERAAGFYGTLPLFFTKLIFDTFALRVVPAFIMGTIVFALIGLSNDGDKFLKFVVVVLLFAAEIGLLCLAFAVAVPDVGTSTLVAAIVILFKMLFAGLLINQESIPSFIRWIQYGSFFRFSYEALIVNDITGIKIEDNVAGATVNIPASIILQKFGFDIDAYFRDLFVSIGITVALLGVVFALLAFRLKEMR